MANNNHFELTLDTLAPQSCSITRPAEYLNANANLTLAATGATYMKVWFNENATGTKEDVGYTGGSWEAYATSKETAFTADGIYYYHVVFMDDVNNETVVYNTGRIVRDTVKPVCSNVSMADKDTGSVVYTNDLTVDFKFDYSDELSMAKKAVITGADIATITLEPIPSETPSSAGHYVGELTFKEGTLDGLKSISVVITDNAGNESVAATASITLDRAMATPVLSLLKTDETSLPAYINYHAIKIQLSSTDTDITGYKIWEGDSEPSTWVEPVSPAEYITFPVKIDHTLSANDGVKTIHAKVRDRAGTEKAAEAVSVTVDSVKPIATVTIKSAAEGGRSIISNVEGYAESKIHLVISDDVAGIKSWILKVDGTQIDSGSAAVEKDFTITSAHLVTDGSHSITLDAVDNAENNADQTSVSIILDTTVPNVSIGTLNEWYNSQFNISVTGSDSNGVVKYQVWTSTVADDTSVPSGTQDVTYSTSPQTISAEDIKWGLAQSASNYMHVKAFDVVGNVNYAHAKFGYDNIAPTALSFAFAKTVYGAVAASLNISASDDTSGMSKMRISGDITNPTGADSWEDYATTRAVTLTSGDGYKYVTIIYQDVAGNASTNTATEGKDKAKTELDTSSPVATVVLFEADGQTPKAAHSAVASLSSRISYTDDEIKTGFKYKLYGDFTYTEQAAQGITEEAAAWTDFVFDEGKAYMSIGNMFCTSNPNDAAHVKTVYVKIKDEAGNVSEAGSASFSYDNTVPVVVVSDVDYNRISKVHSLRRNASGEIANKYADQTNFTFTPDDVIQAYKVCAYLDETAAAKGSHEDNPIPSTAGSVNMSATGLSSSAAVNAMIKGADYETALGGEGHDGAHIVVVYVQNMAGLWSVAAVFTA